MPVTPAPDSLDPTGLPRYQSAARQGRLLGWIFLICLLLTALLLVSLWRGWLPQWRPVLVAQAAMLLVLLAVVQSVWWLTRWRSRILHPLPELLPPDTGWRAHLSYVWRLRLRRMGDLLTAHTQAAAAVSATLLALLALAMAWTPDVTEAGGWVAPPLVVSGVLLAWTFALLVLERYYAGQQKLEMPEAPQLVYPLRVAITVALICAGAVLLVDAGRTWPIRVLEWVVILPLALAVELLLRALLSAFAPPQTGEPELVAESLLASLWRWPFRPLAHLQEELHKSFGIDLRQSWAFAYIRRALLPVCGVLVGIAWLLTGLTEIPLAGRGIYERFGRPVAVWQPGFHLGLPWPLGQVRLVENGVVHELAAVSASDDERKFPTEPEADTAEGPPPASANRLWDASHVAEKSQVIASSASAAGQQSFHIVNMDVRFHYRIGLDDASALAASYNSDDLPGLVRRTAGRILVAYFASRTLEGVLGERRVQLAQDIGARLQAELQALNTGVEIMTTVVESIHPPAAAAYSYHSVQAAQIRAQAIISRERGNAARELSQSQVRAGMTADQAAASARETLAVAEAAERRFTAEREAYAKGGRAFLLEQYLAQLAQGLGSARLVLVDHRLDTASTALDLRTFAAGSALSPAAAGQLPVTVDPYDK